MSASYLITWNPNKWNFEGGYSSFLNRIRNGEKPVEEWSVVNSSIQKGDTLYLMRLGVSPRGIVAKGIALDEVHYSEHWDSDLAKNGVKTKHVSVQFVSAVDFKTENYLKWDALKEYFPNQNWTPQGSGIAIKEEYIHQLDDKWNDCVNSASNSLILYRKDIKHNIVTIKINKSYREGMSAQALYEYTRGFWRRKIDSVSQAEFALAVVYGKVVEVYAIDKWVRAEQADNVLRTYDPVRHSDRIAFVGSVAPKEIREYYMGRSVDLLFKNGEADPVKMFLKFDSSDESTASFDINVPMRPKNRIRKADGSVRLVCGRCQASFAKSPRCPECGQLVKE